MGDVTTQRPREMRQTHYSSIQQPLTTEVFAEMDISVSYTPGYGYARYLPGFDKPMICFGDEFAEFVKERATQNFANKHETVLSPNAPATYNPMDSFDRRELTKDEFAKLTAELAAKYDPANMTQEEYDSLLDDFVEEGILCKNELGPLGYHGWIIVGSLAEGGTGLSGGTLSVDTATLHNNPFYQRYGLAFSLSDTDGNALAYAKLMALLTPTSGLTAGWLAFAEKRQSSFEALAGVLEAMQK